MKYANFFEAYLDGDLKASQIGLAVELAMRKLVEKNLVPDSTRMWKGMCETAWAFHLKEQQMREG